MARERNRVIELAFPSAGLSKSVAVQRQPPYTTPSALNVRPFDVFQDRLRGGSRPGLTDSSTDSTGAVINLLERLDQLPDDGFRTWTDSFDSDVLQKGWAPVIVDTPRVPVIDTGYLRHDYAASNPQGVLAMPHLPIAISQQFSVRYYIPTVDVYLSDPSTPVDVGNGEFGLLFHQLANYVGYTQKWFANVAFTNSFKAAQVIVKFDNGSAVYDQTTSVDNVAEVETLEFVVANRNQLRVYWAGTLIAEYTLSPAMSSSDDAKNRLGVYMKSTESSKTILISSVRVDYYNRDYSAFTSTESIVVLASGGQLYKQSGDGLEAVGSSTAISTTFPLRGVSHGGKLYIADRLSAPRLQSSNGYIDEVLNTTYEARLKDTGELDFSNHSISANEHYAVLTTASGGVVPGSYQISAVTSGYLTLSGYPVGGVSRKGGCTYRIERAPLIYDPYKATVEAWRAQPGKGVVPAGCHIIQKHQGRMVLAGLPANAFWMSRREDPDDWDYLSSYDDVSQAVFGIVPCPITAVIPATDSGGNSNLEPVLFLAGADQLYALAGDIGLGGGLTAVSLSVGVISPDAWCHVPDGGFVFLSNEGHLYYMAPDASAQPQPLTRDRLTNGLLLDGGWPQPWPIAGGHVMLRYDRRDQGIHIFCFNMLSTGLPGTLVTRHYWFCWRTKSLWPVTLGTSDCYPTRIVGARPYGEDIATVLLAGKDGQLRHFDAATNEDDGAGFTTFYDIGPLQLGPAGAAGKLTSLDLTLANDSAAVAYYVWAGDDAETVLNLAQGTGSVSGSVSRDGRNPMTQIELGGAYGRVRVAGQAYSRWAIEQLLATVRPVGRFRLEV